MRAKPTVPKRCSTFLIPDAAWRRLPAPRSGAAVQAVREFIESGLSYEQWDPGTGTACTTRGVYMPCDYFLHMNSLRANKSAFVRAAIARYLHVRDG